MKEEKFTKILGEINEEYVREVLSEEKPRKTVPFRKWAALAACICILAVSATAVVAKMININYSIEQDVIMKVGPRDRNVSYYDVSFNLEPIDDKELSKELREHFEERREHFKEDGRALNFDSAEEAAEYIGYEKLVVPDLGLEPAIHYLADSPEVTFSARVWPMGRGRKIERVDLHSYYDTSEKMSVFCLASIYTDNYDMKQGIETQYQFLDVFLDITHEERTTENGTEYLVVYVPMNYGGAHVKAFLVKDNIAYSLQTQYSWNSERAEIEEIILRWANSF